MNAKKLFGRAFCGMTAAALSAAALTAAASADETVDGYMHKIIVTPGPALCSELGIDISNFEFDISGSADGSASKAAVLYNDKSLATINANYDAGTDRIYLQIPELSSDVLYIDLAQLDEEYADEEGVSYSELLELLESEDASELSDLDIDSILESLESYADTFIDALGEGESGTASGTLTGDMEYSYDTITYSLTAEDLNNALSSTLQQVSDSELGGTLAELLGYSSLDEIELTGMFDDEVSYALTLYSDDGSVMGIKLSVDSDEIGFIAAADGDKLALETFGEDRLALLIDDSALTLSIYSAEELYISIAYSAYDAEFEVFTLDTEGAYNLLDDEEFEAYLENADFDGFLENAKTVLGSDLYKLLFESDLGYSGSSPTESDESDGTADTSDSSLTSDSSGNSSSSSASGSSASASASSDESPNTGAAALGMTAAVLFAAAIVVVKKK